MVYQIARYTLSGLVASFLVLVSMPAWGQADEAAQVAQTAQVAKAAQATKTTEATKATKAAPSW